MNRAEHSITRCCVFFAVAFVCAVVSKPEGALVIAILAVAIGLIWLGVGLTVKE
jgi:hypothetical protein